MSARIGEDGLTNSERAMGLQPKVRVLELGDLYFRARHLSLRFVRQHGQYRVSDPYLMEPYLPQYEPALCGTLLEAWKALNKLAHRPEDEGLEEFNTDGL